MDILNTISVTTRAADTLFHVATHNWDKKSLIRLVIAGATLTGIVAIINSIESKKEG